jgi:hypothetical protein
MDYAAMASHQPEIEIARTSSTSSSQAHNTSTTATVGERIMDLLDDESHGYRSMQDTSLDVMSVASSNQQSVYIEMTDNAQAPTVPNALNTTLPPDPVKPHVSFSSTPSEEYASSQSTPHMTFFQELMLYNRNRNWKKKVLSVFIVFTSFYVLYDLLYLGNVQRIIVESLEWMTRHPFGAVYAFILFFILATLLFVPPAILYFGAGYAFTNVCQGSWIGGVVAGTTVSLIGSCLGALVAFFRSRYMMRDMMELFAKRFPIVQAADRAIAKNGLRVMILLRLW